MHDERKRIRFFDIVNDHVSMHTRNYAHMRLIKDIIMSNAKTSRRNVVVETRNIVLKTIHDDIMRDNANAIITTKKMRVWLRANAHQFAHAHNASWTFTQREYDIVRSHFDPKYASKIERANKRNNATNDAPKARKSRARKIDVAQDIVDTNANASALNVDA